MKARSLCLLVFALFMTCAGCAGFGSKIKAFMAGQSGKPQPQSKPAATTFSKNPNLNSDTDKNYRRMNRNRFESQARLGEASGSLWVKEGQSAYLFSENVLRRVGDVSSVRLVGAPKEQLEAKVRVIERLTKKLQQRRSRRLAAVQKRRQAVNQDKSVENKPDQAENETQQDQQNDRQPAAQQPDPPTSFNVERVPVRITERLRDGNYRIKGSQSFMIGKREYRVLVTGIVKAEDFNETDIDANVLLDPKFDIVSLRGGAS